MKTINLDTQQTQAVQATDNNILCIAGPGSGKTRVLVERTAHLIENCGVSPHEILLITFTRMAAGEMRKRIEDRVGDQARHIEIGTFHSFALKTLKRFGDLIGYRHTCNLTVYGEWESAYLLKETAIDMGVYVKGKWKVPKREVDRVFNHYYATGEVPTENSPVWPLFWAFIDRCKENQSLTYGGLLVGLRLLLPQIEKYLKFKHIMVDEAHDNTTIQWDLVKEIQNSCAGSLFVVCDLDQSIFSFRSAVPRWILDHQSEFTVYKLENNYRSVPEIVEAANNLISHNTERIEKTMRPVRVDSTMKAVTIKDSNADSKGLAKFIKNSFKKNSEYLYGLKDTVVLSRIHALLDKLSEELTALGVPHEKIGRKTELVESEEFRRFHAFLKLIVNPFDNFSFLLVREILGLTREHYQEIRYRSSQEGKSHFQAFQEWYSTRFPSGGLLVDAFEFIGKAFYSSDPDEPLGADLSLEIATFINQYIDDNPDATIQQYLDWLALWGIQDELAEDHGDKVRLMTVFAAKGLEFPVVLLIGCNEGIMPSKQAVAAGNVEEERRLFYVAFTRAMERFIGCVRPEISEGKGGKVYDNPVSRFIKEMNE